ncbi:MAG: molybdopterin molybdotransferase MoeA, partial [Terriglobales bacterium]
MSIVSFVEARRVVEFQATSLRPKGTETANLLNAHGRVLAEAIPADRDFPPFPRATRDGYAVRSLDLAEGPAILEVKGEIKAGGVPIPDAGTVQRRQTYAIMTGASLPPGADAVAMVEYTSLRGGTVSIERAVRPGENVVPRGAEARCGETLLDAGDLLGEAAIAIAASVGKSDLHVFTKPTVAILSTGDEIVDIAAAPGPAQIRNSN